MKGLGLRGNAVAEVELGSEVHAPSSSRTATLGHRGVLPISKVRLLPV